MHKVESSRNHKNMSPQQSPPGRYYNTSARSSFLTSSTSAHRNPRTGPPSSSKEDDTNILRGAEIIRRHIRKQVTEISERLRTSSPGPTSPEEEEEVAPRRQSSARKANNNNNNNKPWQHEFAWTPPERHTHEQQQRPPVQPITQQQRKVVEAVSSLPSSRNNSSSNDIIRNNNNQSGDNFSEFSDLWNSSKEEEEEAHHHHQRSNSGTVSVEVDPPAGDDDWGNLSGVDLTETYNLARTPSSKGVDPELVLRSSPLSSSRSPPPSTKDTSASSSRMVRERNRRMKAAATYSEPLVADDDLLYDDDDDEDIASVDDSRAMFTSPEKDVSGGRASMASSSSSPRKSYLPPQTVAKNSLKSPVSFTSPVGTKFVDSSDYTYDEGGKAVVVTPKSPDRLPSPESSSTSSSLSASPGHARYPQLNPVGEYEEKNRSRSRIMGNSSRSSQPNSLQSLDSSSTSSQQRTTPSKKKNKVSNSPPQIDDQSDERYVSPVKQEQRPAKQSPRHSARSSRSSATARTSSSAAYCNNLYGNLLDDPAYQHAQHAGFLWQSVVGQHVRFPTNWWNGARGPPIGCQDSADGRGEPPKWIYFGRHRINKNQILTQLVKTRASAGRLLLHVVVQDLMTRRPVQDIAIGCFHPNSKCIRRGDRALKSLENCRDVWLAVRKRTAKSVSAVDSLLYSQCGEDGSSRSPLGPGQRVTNQNVRAVFGEKPPLETIFMSEDELYERLSYRIMAPSGEGGLSPPMAILQEFVFA